MSKSLTRHRVAELLSHLQEAWKDPFNHTNTVLRDNLQAMKELLIVKDAIMEAEKENKIHELDRIYPIL